MTALGRPQLDCRSSRPGQARAAKEADVAAAPTKASSKTASSKTTAKMRDVGTVQKIDARAERIKARKEAGEEAPSLFGF